MIRKPKAVKPSTLVCPECIGEKVTVTEETMWMVNTGDHYCHSVKAHDADAEVSCLDCGWEGKRHHLKPQGGAA